LVRETENICPYCGGELIFFDKTKRIIRTKGRKSSWIKINRLKCVKCGKTHRVLPNYILPYKQYEKELIKGVLEGLIDSDTLGYEDYPCEKTMKHWRRDI